MKTSIIKNLSKLARTVAVLAFWIFIWHLIAVKVDLTVLVPTPAEVAKRLATLMSQGEFYVIIFNSVIRKNI